MNLTTAQLKFIRVTLFLPAIYFALLALVSLFIPYEPNPRYYPLPLHLVLYATSLFFLPLWFYQQVQKSKWKPMFLIVLPLIFAITHAVQLIFACIGDASLFSANSKLMPDRVYVITRIIVPIGLLYCETAVSKVVDFIFREPAKP